MKQHDPYIRYCQVLRVIDGDTLDVNIDLGFHLWTKQRLRLLGVNTPEMRGESKADGQRAKIFTISWLNQHGVFDPAHDTWHELVLRTEKSDAFGRYLAVIYSLRDPTRVLNTDLVDSGNAVPFMVPKEATTSGRGTN